MYPILMLHACRPIYRKKHTRFCINVAQERGKWRVVARGNKAENSLSSWTTTSLSKTYIYIVIFILLPTARKLRRGVTAVWCNARLHRCHLMTVLYYVLIILALKSTRMRGRCMWHVWETGGAYRDLVGRSEGKRVFGRRSRRRECNIKVDIHEVGWGGMDWLNLA